MGGTVRACTGIVAPSAVRAAHKGTKLWRVCATWAMIFQSVPQTALVAGAW
jgi:hypothetical protein